MIVVHLRKVHQPNLLLPDNLMLIMLECAGDLHDLLMVITDFKIMLYRHLQLWWWEQKLGGDAMSLELPTTFSAPATLSHCISLWLWNNSLLPSQAHPPTSLAYPSVNSKSIRNLSFWVYHKTIIKHHDFSVHGSICYTSTLKYCFTFNNFYYHILQDMNGYKSFKLKAFQLTLDLPHYSDVPFSHNYKHVLIDNDLNAVERHLGSYYPPC